MVKTDRLKAIYYPFSKTKTNLGFTVGLVLLFGALFLLQTSHLLWGEWSFDQGHNLLIARLMDDGYRPYSEIFMDRPPLFFWSIQPPLSFFGSVEGMQLVMVGYALLAIAAVVSAGISLDGKLTGLLAGLFLGFNFSFFVTAHSVMPEIPAMSLGLVSLALALRYYNSGKQSWLIASGAAMGGSLLINYFMPWLIPLILLILILPPGGGLQLDRPAALRRGLLWTGLVLLVALGGWLAYNVSQVFDQAILFHLYKTEGTESSFQQNLTQIWAAIARQPLLTAVAFLGLGLAIANFRQKGWLLIIWLGLTLAFLLLYSPLRSKHLIILPPVLALFAALRVAYLLKRWLKSPARVDRLRWLSLAGAVLLLAAIIVELALPYQALARPDRHMIPEEMQPLAALLGQFTTPADCVITDNPYLAFVTRRVPPPWLANLSYARFASGLLTTSQMVEITEQQNCQVVAPILDRIKNANRSYYDWAKANYLRTWVLDGKEIMLGKRLAQVRPMIPLDAGYAGQVALVGADWYPHPQGGYLSLYWKTLRPFSQNYKIFVQLRNEAGQTVASADHEAYNGLVPTQLWPVDWIFKDTNRLDWPPDLQPGTYTLYVGFYDPATLERLPVNADTSGENAVMIPGIVVE